MHYPQLQTTFSAPYWRTLSSCACGRLRVSTALLIILVWFRLKPLVHPRLEVFVVIAIWIRVPAEIRRPYLNHRLPRTGRMRFSVRMESGRRTCRVARSCPCCGCALWWRRRPDGRLLWGLCASPWERIRAYQNGRLYAYLDSASSWFYRLELVNSRRHLAPGIQFGTAAATAAVRRHLIDAHASLGLHRLETANRAPFPARPYVQRVLATFPANPSKR